MNDKYAVVEWEGKDEDGEGWVSVIAKDLDRKTAELLVGITPDGYTRETLTMEELATSKSRWEMGL